MDVESISDATNSTINSLESNDRLLHSQEPENEHVNDYGLLEGDDDNNEQVSSNIMRIAKQSKLYKNQEIEEEVCADTVQCVQRYLRRIYRQVKFFSDTKEDYKEPCFVSKDGRKKQTVVLCEWILENIKRDKVSIEEKIGFWKTYRKQIKTDINKMRQNDMNGFNKKFKKGEYHLLNNIYNVKPITYNPSTYFSLKLFQLEYTDKFYCGIDEEHNDMKKLVKFCKNNGHQFGDKLLDYDNMDIETLKYFYDISMPSISSYMYSSRILFNTFSRVITESEEAFAILVFENSFDRWLYQADSKISAPSNDTEEQTVTVEEGTIAIQGSTVTGNDAIPDVLYQKKVKKRKDNVVTAGRWTDAGLGRYNELLTKVQEARKGRGVFEDSLKETYVMTEPSDLYLDKLDKRNRSTDNEHNARKKKKVQVKNVLNVAEL